MRYTEEVKHQGESKHPGLHNPDRALLAAILERAIADFFKAPTRKCGRKPKTTRRYIRKKPAPSASSATEWFESEEVIEFSFKWICDNLDMDHEELRNRLFYLKEAGLPISKTDL